MASAPLFKGPDGVLRQQFTLTTTVPTRFYEGTMDAATVDMQVSLRGGAFTSDPDLITFEGTTFFVPNPTAYPDGFQLLPGENEIRVKSILASGEATQEAVVQTILSQEADLGAAVEAPSGIFVEQFDRTVKISVEGLASENVAGYHIYASPQPGGGEIGYYRINPSLLATGDTVDRESDLATLAVDASIVLDAEGFHAADPLFFRVTGGQEGDDETPLITNFNEVVEVPETADRLRVEIGIKNVRRLQVFSFVHDRQATLTDPKNPAIPHSALATVPSSDPLYYIVTAVHLIDGVEVESAFSAEVVGRPLEITPAVGAFPQVSRQQIVQDTVLSIYRSQPQVKFDPGSVLRDTFIDPFSVEADRIRFIIDFLHNAQSFATLLLIDDPTLSGTSVPVNQSGYKRALKQAFFLTNDLDVQTIIDNCFDKLASNYGVTRDSGKRARGEVTFYVRERPTTPITRAIGTVVSGGGVRFITTSSATITSVGSGASFSPTTGRYFARAFIQAESPGTDGNLAAGQIRTILSNTLKVEVLNEGATFGGTNRESNRDLAVRAMGVLSSVDSGTLQGYTQNATQVPGVRQAWVIEAGHELMMRDRNDSGRHVGGKVDIWLRGSSEAKVTDAFAFSFDVAKDVQFEPVGDLTNLRFRAVDTRLSADNPIIEMLHIEGYDLVFENVSKGYVFDLTDVQIVDYDSIELSATYNDPTAHDLDDEIRGAFRFRTSNKFVLTRQPVISVSRFEGAVTGLVPEGVFYLFRASDPLLMGRSSEAGDYVQVVQPLEETTIPSGTPIAVTGEAHTMVGGVEYLNNLGANPYTVRIFNADRTTEYAGPFVNGHRDFTIVEGDETTPVGIKLTDGSLITEGQTVLVDYSHDENFVVEYRSNAVVLVTQGIIDNDRHITADTLAKWAVEVPVDISATIVLQPNQSKSQVDSRVRTNLTRYFDTLAMGTPLRQADVIGVIETTPGVAYPVVPLTKMVRGDGALIVREPLESELESDSVKITAWSSPTVTVYLLLSALDAATSNAGGAVNDFRGVFQDEARLTHHDKAPNVNGFPLRNTAGGVFIIGSDGLYIPGYSDNATIEANNVLPSDPDKKAAEILRIRKELTANRVLVSFLAGGDDPDNPTKHHYTATYVVKGDTGTKNIETGPIEYLVPGNFDFAYDEAPKRR